MSMADPEAGGAAHAIKGEVADLKAALVLANYKNAEAPSDAEEMANKVKRELKQRWWLWLAGGFIVFTLLGLWGMSGHMYKHLSDPGMPELALEQQDSAFCKESCEAKADGEGKVAPETADTAADVGTGVIEIASFNMDKCMKDCLDEHKQEVKEEHDEAAEAAKEEAAAEVEGAEVSEADEEAPAEGDSEETTGEEDASAETAGAVADD